MAGVNKVFVRNVNSPVPTGQRVVGTNQTHVLLSGVWEDMYKTSHNGFGLAMCSYIRCLNQPFG